MRFALLGVLLMTTACAALPTHKNDPENCRERVAFNLADSYPDPANLAIVIDTICQDAKPNQNP